MRTWLWLAMGLLLVVSPAVAEEPKATDQAAVDPEHAQKMAQGMQLFRRDIRPILTGRCLKCHGGDKTEGEFSLQTRETLLKGGSQGPAVVVGKPLESLMYRLAAHLDEPNMPQDGAKLSDIALQQLAKWIELGAPYDGTLVGDENEDPLAWTLRKIDDSRREFWSFQPLKPVVPPEVVDVFAQTPIDQFVLAKLHEHKLHLNPPADRRTLLRRAYFDLLGLPPPAEEVCQFVNDPDPDAYSKLIDRLLESPHYGERWGRHWLDVARFAESHGFEQDYDRPHAYHYRDFVIKALNADMPYDQFVRWQLAGDEYQPDDPLALMATGFLGAGVFPTQLTEKEFESARYDELDDMISTTGTAFLGLTIGCARCHDHKFDPIPAADYYRLIASFTTAIRSNIELELNPEATRQALAQWEAERAPLVASLKQFEDEQLPARFEKWLADQPKVTSPPPTWITLDLVDYKSAGGATLTPQPDGSLLATGTNPDFDKYTFIAHTQLTGITSIRLEALKHESMVKGGPGRAGNGNIGLGSITVTAEPLSGTGPPTTVRLRNPRATFQQNDGGLSIASSLDDQPKTGWALDPQFGEDHAAVLEAEQPIGLEGGTKLTFTLDFTVNNQHNIGRPRLSISSAAVPVALDGSSQRQSLVEVLDLLSKDRAALTEDERRRLRDYYRTIDPEWLKLNGSVQEHVAKKPAPQLTPVMVVSEGFKPIPHHADGRGFPHFYPESFFLKRGDANQKLSPASQGFLQVLMPASSSTNESPSAHWQPTLGAGSRTSGRRSALAAWITDKEQGAGQLVARVIVNRLWQHHLGRGIVSTPNDFGFQGQRPTHPELLDWLAARLMANGWRLKPLHKEIMTSATYMQTSSFDAEAAVIDPENQWLWRYSPQRLEAEIIRDALLAVSGRLDRTMFGPGSLDEAMSRRSIYFMVKRSKLIPMMQVFDAPEPLVGVGQRPSTTIAPQALVFMNSPQVRSDSLAFARRLAATGESSRAAAIDTAYLTALARPPTPAEQSRGVQFLESQVASYQADGKANALELALADFCQVLLSLNEFVYLD